MIRKCLNCKKEFVVKNKKKSRNFKYCSGKCYWQYHLKDIIGGNNYDRRL